MSSPSTFMTPGETCLLKSWKENRDGSYKVFFHVPYFGARQCAGRYFAVLSLHISNIFAKKKGIAEKFQVTSMELHGGTAAKTTSELWTKLFWTVSCTRHRATHHCGDLDTFQTSGPTSVDFSNRLALIDLGK